MALTDLLYHRVSRGLRFTSRLGRASDGHPCVTHFRDRCAQKLFWATVTEIPQMAWEGDLQAPSQGSRDGWAILHKPCSHSTWWVEGPHFSWQCEAMCKFNLWVYDSISLQQMSREMSGWG